jgi:polyisoprenoid-binding protein YceI
MPTYQIDLSHSAVEFTVRHLVISKVKGRFTRFNGDFHLDDKDITKSSLKVTIEADSIDTNDAKRDAHLRSADFFDVEKFPILTFAGTGFERAGAGYRVTGDLTIHGVTREITLDVEDLGSVKDPWGNTRVAFSVSGALDRKDYGLHWNAALETGGFVVGDKIQIHIEVEAIQQAAAAAA